jgi:FKBP-type peptidyl-prolyl cis-trans isomerase FklB
MRLSLITAGLALALLAGQTLAQESLPTAQPEVKDLKPKISYIIGHSIGKRIEGDQMDLDINNLIKGIQDGLAGAPSQFSSEETAKVLAAFEAQMKAEEPKRLAQTAEKNKRDGEAFLDANKKKDGVVATNSGLQYKVLKQGTGPSPKPTDQVTVNYKGTLLTGEQFDSSYDRGQPVTFGVKDVIPGWTEALQLMKVGDKWELYIPSNLAYGPRGAGAEIGPNSTLIFEVELLGVQPQG